MLGNLRHEYLAAVHLRQHGSTNCTAWSSVSQKRVIRGSVMVILPVVRCSGRAGITLPRLPTTLP